jgi:phosphate starvation-inducible protein PhoH
MSRKRKHNQRAQIYDLTEALVNNGKAMQDGPKKKSWTKHDLKHIKPLTSTQEEMFRAFFEGKHICAHGSAGTGKTFIAIYLALNEMLHAQTIDQIIIVRSAVPTREMGFMPGTLAEKEALYELPYAEMFAEILGKRDSYQNMKDAGVVRFCTTSYVRGLTWDNAIVIIDEGQNMTFHEIDSIVTRLGENSRVIFAGDQRQSDLSNSRRQEQSGLESLINVATAMSAFAVIRFTKHDIVRSAFVKSWICACEEIV